MVDYYKEFSLVVRRVLKQNNLTIYLKKKFSTTHGAKSKEKFEIETAESCQF